MKSENPSSRAGCSYSVIETEQVSDNEEDNGNLGTMGNNFEKLCLLMYKNLLLKFRNPIQTCIEIFAPVFFSILLVQIRRLVNPEENAAKLYTPFCVLPFACSDSNSSEIGFSSLEETMFRNVSLVYSPASNAALARAMGILDAVFGNVIGFNNSQQLEAHFLDVNSTLTFAGIQLDDNVGDQDELPDDVEVSIRFPSELRRFTDLFGQNHWHTNILYPVYQVPGPRAPDNNTGAVPGYFQEGFLSLQFVMTYVLAFGAYRNVTTLDQLKTHMFSFLPPIIKMQRFPYASWISDPLLQALTSFVGIIIMLSFVYTCINTVKVITTEKERQLKEAMKIMGLPNWLHWTAWFIRTFIFLFISIILIVILLTVAWYPKTSCSVFTHADRTVMLAFLTLYICATITFCFAISVFFSKANTAATVAGLFWFLSYSPYMFMQQQYDQLSLSAKLISSLGSNTAMAYGFQLMLMYEGTSEGIQWNNIAKPITPDDSLTLALVMLMLIFDAVIYLLIALYVEAIFPGEYGVPKPWHFPFTSVFHYRRPRYVGVKNFMANPIVEDDFFEKEPSGSVGIQIKHLRKVFGKKPAVKNLSLNIFNDQITVLLGHNGAGKTTTMSMLTGMYPPTSGTAIINGYDITTDMDQVRSSLGLCPQHNIVFDDLTVEEHFDFFSKLKGLKHEAAKEETDKYIDLLELRPKAKSKASTLSGGMKRKLCVGIALCGNSKVVILDEPTAGMDPSARRALWDLLQKEKEGRTLLLTTHFMDEADVLGDRIAIMAAGELQCCGSSFFLKKKYGAGYCLIIDKSPSCQPERVTQLLQKHISHIEPNGNVGSELTYLLTENQSHVFQDLLQDLEQNMGSLGIRSFGISLTTLEEVFMKAGADLEQDVDSNETNQDKKKVRVPIGALINSRKTEPNSQQARLTIENIVLLTGVKLTGNQFLAMLMKKSLTFIRTWILQCVQIIIPVVFLIIAIIVGRNIAKARELPKLPITLTSYHHPITLVEEKYNGTYSRAYTELLKGHHMRVISNITEEMLHLTKTVPGTVRMRYIIGATFEKYHGFTLIKAWFNNDPYHSPPLALGLILNIVFKEIVGTNRNIRFANYPLPFTTTSKVRQLMRGQSRGFQFAFNIGFSMAFVSSFYVLFYVKERISKCKHLQFVSGVKVWIFWLTSFFCDLLTFMVTVLAIIITLVCFREEGFRSLTDLTRFSFILLYFGIAVLPMMYLCAYCFKIPSTGYTRMTLFSIFTGVSNLLVVQVLATPNLELEYVADALHWVFLLVPHYSLATGIRDTYTTYATNKMCKIFVDTCVKNRPNMTVDSCWYLACHNNATGALADYCCVREPSYYKWESPGIGRNLLYSLSFGLFLFIFLNLLEYKICSRIFEKFCSRYRKRRPLELPDEDSDVKDEKHMIDSTPERQLMNNYFVVMKNLTKYYKKLLAVNGLSLGIEQLECFGLLGVNGAGKTSTFKMMTGDVAISYGDVWVKGYSVKKQLKTVQKLIGYCPQFDALLDELTAEESLIMFALLRGVPLKETKYVATKLAKDFDFYQHLHKKVKQLSGGNKRKLSTAISLIGDPPVIYLDEPSTGMDPATKRYLWDAICKVRDSGKCIVLTSHSMEECEALCTRLAIMVNGNFKCLGSIQHLKDKFAKGYTLTIKVKKSTTDENYNSENIEKFIISNFPTAIQREKHQEFLTYYIKDNSIPLSKMFGNLEKGKSEVNIEDYSIGQSSLEQVFLTFTKSQE